MMMGMSPKTQKDLVKNKTSSTIHNNYKLFAQSPSVNNNLSNLYYSSNNSISSVNLHDNSAIVIHNNNYNNNTNIMSNNKMDVIKSKRFTQSRRSSVTSSIAYSLTEDGDESSSSSSYKLDHIPSSPIGMDFRVGFSIQNLTGQPVRYLQEWEGSRRTVQYLNHNERGLLNFVASKSVIRNNIAIEETFDVQLEHNTLRGNSYSASSNSNSNSSRKTRRGNSVALQISGYKWLSSIQADVLGVNYQELDTVVGKMKPTFVCKNWRIDNALKLMVEVVPFCGGRMLKLSSVFKIKNNTKHKLKILAKEGFSSSFLSSSASASNRGNYVTYNTSTAAGGIVEVGDEKDIPFYLDAGDLFHIPIPLLRRSALSSQGKSLGYLYLQPYDISPIEEELLFRPNCNVGSVEYTTDPINLFQTIQRSYDIIDSNNSNNTMNNNSNGNSGSIKMNSDSYVSSSSTKDRFFQLICPIHPRVINKRSPSQRTSGLNSNQHHQKQQHQKQNSLQQSYQQQQQQQNDNITDYDRHEFMSRTSSVIGSNKLPPFCYCIEVQKDQVSSSDVQKEMLPTSLSRFFYNQRDHHGISSPSNFTISSYYYYC